MKGTKKCASVQSSSPKKWMAMSLERRGSKMPKQLTSAYQSAQTGPLLVRKNSKYKFHENNRVPSKLCAMPKRVTNMNAHTNKPCTQRPNNFVETTNITLRANTCNAHTRHKLPNRAILRSCGHGACTRSKHLLLGMHAPTQLHSDRNNCSCVRVHAKHQSQQNKPR
jgi:hypothetical protein